MKVCYVFISGLARHKAARAITHFRYSFWQAVLVLQITGVYHGPLPPLPSSELRCSRAPWLPERYSGSPLLRAHPSPSRRQPGSNQARDANDSKCRADADAGRTALAYSELLQFRRRMERKQSPDLLSSETTRRQTLKIMAGSATATLGLPIVIDAAPQTVSHAAHAQTQEAVPHVLKHFSVEQAQSIDALAEVIIPADDHSPGAKAAKVHEYIDEVVSVSLDSVKKLWADGLAAMDRMARGAYGQEYARSDGPQQTAMMEKISRNEGHPSTLEEKFFGALKAASIDGYYTSSIGIHDDLEYQGNTVVVEFPGCGHDEHKKG